MSKGIEPIKLASYSRHELIKYIRELESENEQLEKRLENAIYTDMGIEAKPKRTFKL